MAASRTACSLFVFVVVVVLVLHVKFLGLSVDVLLISNLVKIFTRPDSLIDFGAI